RLHGAGRAECGRAAIDALPQQLAAAVGLGGGDRPGGAAAGRARTTVSRRLRAVIRRIARQHPGLGDRLPARVRTGMFCTYTPDPERPIDWALGPWTLQESAAVRAHEEARRLPRRPGWD